MSLYTDEMKSISWFT